MGDKIGRNEPCPCGSGRKFKHCHGKPDARPDAGADSHVRAIERVVRWLAQHHRKAFAAAVEEEIDGAVLACFDDDEQAAAAAMARLDDALWQQIRINFTEWVIAEGDMRVKGRNERVADVLLGAGGPLLTAAQRAWIEQLAERPLRLYDVTDVEPGASITLCDALDDTQAPRVVTERSGSRTLRPGMALGARVLPTPGGFELSGAIYPFAPPVAHALRDELRRLAADPEMLAEDLAPMSGLEINLAWLRQWLLPAPLPRLVHAASGEPLLFTTDHYDVADWPALEAALAAQPDVRGSREAGWDRLVAGDDGLERSQARVEREAAGRRVSLQYPTAGLAERGRPWFEQLAGSAVKFVLREVSDPRAALAEAEASAPAPAAAQALPEGIDAEQLAEVLAKVARSSYANWADEPIPALDGRTPRQAIATPGGLERVKGLLRHYEDGEDEQARSQGRRPISYQFLWDALGIAR